MQSIENYINDRYDNNATWFEEEVKQGEHIHRISNVLNNKSYLSGQHRILNREDAKWKGKEFITTKLVLQEAKTILNFHSTYLLGKPISLKGSEDMVEQFNKVYRKGRYNRTDFNILDKVSKYGDCYEYVYVDNKTIKSKLINAEDGYPIYSEDTGEYICFVEHYTTNSNKVSYYNIYYKDRVECWNNEGGDLHLIDEKINISGLPIHYKNFNDSDSNCGRSDLEDIKPILDQIEDILSKMTDAVYTLSLNPIGVAIGQRVVREGSDGIPADAVGYSINIDAGSFDFINANMDYSTIKLLLDTLHKKLETIAGIPSVAMGNSNVANVSEVSLSMLYSLASVKAMMNEQWLRDGFYERFEKIQKILAMQGIVFSDDDYIDVEFNYSKPINQQELLQNLKTQWEMGAISLQTIIEKSEITQDVTQELQRLTSEKNEDEKEDIKTDKNKEFGSNKIDNGINTEVG
ncbi:phage portal protein [Clostridium sporogenes]|uniref:phage portal protein n=1 Tax=Clostridium sporogenes TaxID=1509 RepID=UPI0013C66CE0|nr:phage portal protein [Clostridium sporogenes]NFT02947.1 phage portal protein [Clostridium sporogenes]NFT32892.1 phage portal protein [Clostridium sporogenes]NFT38425.1 phage portal protein [Clostridium sporogenes]NFT52626.1 phage portal protein [Clostridium sporogenes]NFT75676.1 phage portal protein [Clostridium sporogenes]